MRQFMTWVKTNAESAVALLLAIFISVLGVVDLVPSDLIAKVIPLTLGVIAFAMLRERWRQETSNADLHRSLLSSNADLHRSITSSNAELHRTISERLSMVAGVRIAAGIEATEALAKARAETDRWIFKGGTGTHTRVVTLPACARAADEQSRTLSIRMEIIDPSDAGLCERYAELYRNLAEDANDHALTWTGKGTQIESFATILAACWYKQNYDHLLDVHVGLSSTLSTFRWDLSSTCLIITQRGPQFPAMIVDRGRPHYNSWDVELKTSFGESRKVPIDDALRGIRLGREPGIPVVRKMFEQGNVPLPDDYEDADVADIIQKALHDRDPYVGGAGDNLTGTPARSFAG
ncbi:hypothetical protein [Amycolatopsis taiwanensis]|uniref:Uncharacterized protein n=1 Tax=Amycolatopsis taiwanensis TaxID=342230 RepID=A0A9W6VGP3_9PSEU|nr:hypothetical protein [Amycolatopsis taiwanensis]GLY65706.1 hypothetical protein Atai01_23250 [Amycolatopsis taiwanensis]